MRSTPTQIPAGSAPSPCGCREVPEDAAMIAGCRGRRADLAKAAVAREILGGERRISLVVADADTWLGS
jgi:hypothetical protein